MPVLGALLWQIVGSLRRGDLGLDIVAALSMSAALAFGETLAGNVVALMYAGGQLLECLLIELRRGCFHGCFLISSKTMRVAGRPIHREPGVGACVAQAKGSASLVHCPAYSVVHSMGRNTSGHIVESTDLPAGWIIGTGR